MEIRVQIGRIGLDSPKTASAAIIVVSRGTESRTGRCYGDVDEGRAVRVAAYPPRSEEQLQRESVRTEILFAPDRWDPAARNRIGTLGAYCDQWAAQSEIDAAVARCRAHLEQELPPAPIVRRTVAPEPVSA